MSSKKFKRERTKPGEKKSKNVVLEIVYWTLEKILLYLLECSSSNYEERLLQGGKENDAMSFCYYIIIMKSRSYRKIY